MIVKRVFVPQAAISGEICPASPKVRKAAEQRSIAQMRKAAMATPPAVPRRVKAMPRGVESRTTTRQIQGWAQR